MSSVSQQNPVRVFVAHAFVDDDDYRRVFEYLESARNFFYRNTSVVAVPQPLDREGERQELRKQINLAEVTIFPASVYRKHLELVDFQLSCAKSFEKPVIVLKHFGTTQALPVQLEALADEVLEWNDRDIVDAIKRQARHEESTRWDTLEFNLDEFKEFALKKDNDKK
jgi:hypothetical protein